MQRAVSRLSFVLIALAVTSIVVLVAWPSLPSWAGDSGWYLAIAQGRLEEVRQPYARRILHPYVARWIAELFGVSLDSAFRALGIVSVFVTSSIVAWLFRSGRILAFPLLATPALLLIFRDYYMPDIFYAGILGILFVLLRKESPAAFLVLAVLFVARESTVLVSLMLVLYAILHRRPKLAAATLIASTVGTLIPVLATTGSQSNIHDLSGPLYLALKVPFNVMRNIFGAELWVSTLGGCDDPVWTWTVPPSLRVGSVEAVGLCRFWAQRPLSLATYLLTSFGVLPVVFFHLRRRFRGRARSLPMWVFVAGGAGLLSLVLTPGLGLALDRLITYAWPLFWIATPYLVSELPTSNVPWARLALLHTALCWIPWLLGWTPWSEVQVFMASIAIAIPLQLVALKSIRRLPLVPDRDLI